MCCWLPCCTGDKFGGAGSSDAEGSDESTDDSNGEDCGSETCSVPACPPQRQFTPEGECCPVCEPPGVCAEGARCEVLDCPAPIELGDGCCTCGDLQCETGALPCTDPACVGTEQDHVGGGCCICGEPLRCPDGQAACDKILCAGNTLYQQDGCCTCEAEECGAGSTACGELTCDDGEVTEVGGGCCVCQAIEPNECGAGTSLCEQLDCSSQVIDHGNDCCSCEPACNSAAGQQPCADISCPSSIEALGDGCCECGGQPVCPQGTAACAVLDCPNAEPVEVVDGCCTCSGCAADTFNCLTIVCPGGVVDLENGCCACGGGSPEDTCARDVQLAYERELQNLKSAGPECAESSDCALRQLRTQCRLDCQVALHVDAADDIDTQMQEWAAEHCADCPEPVGKCPEQDDSDADDARVANCVGGQCVAQTSP